MRRWEIRLANQPPIRVMVEDTRNLVAEYQQFREYVTQKDWRFWRPAPSPYWAVSPEVVLHHEIVAGIRPKDAATAPRRIGFHHEEGS